MIGRSGERGSGISVLVARHDDDDDDDDDDDMCAKIVGQRASDQPGAMCSHYQHFIILPSRLYSTRRWPSAFCIHGFFLTFLFMFNTK